MPAAAFSPPCLPGLFPDVVPSQTEMLPVHGCDRPAVTRHGAPDGLPVLPLHDRPVAGCLLLLRAEFRARPADIDGLFLHSNAPDALAEAAQALQRALPPARLQRAPGAGLDPSQSAMVAALRAATDGWAYLGHFGAAPDTPCPCA